jgi:hypothetical protein
MEFEPIFKINFLFPGTGIEHLFGNQTSGNAQQKSNSFFPY